MVEHIREVLSGPPDPEYLKQRTEAGWKLVAVEWQRQAEGEGPESLVTTEDVPYGSRVANDCLHLEENPDEVRALTLMLELIVQDRPLARMAEELNRQGHRTRDGSRWTKVAIFNMLPRLIEVGPRILSSQAWGERRKQLFRVG